MPLRPWQAGLYDGQPFPPRLIAAIDIAPGSDVSCGHRQEGNFISKSLRRKTMKSGTRDQAEGKFHKAKGKLKETAGKLSDNPKLEAEGTDEKIAGLVQEKIGKVKKVFGK
jgi:uncharacterized protein YjbJ (UPF0337 family)